MRLRYNIISVVIIAVVPNIYIDIAVMNMRVVEEAWAEVLCC
jgi:hypothetical protein